MNLVRFDTFEASPVAGEGEGAAPGCGGAVLVLARGRRHLHLLLGAHEGGEAEVPLLDLGPHLRLDAEQVLVLDMRQHLVQGCQRNFAKVFSALHSKKDPYRASQ